MGLHVKELRSVAPRDVARFVFSADAALARNQLDTLIATPGGLEALGIAGLTQRSVRKMFAAAMDADLPPTVTTPSITTPVQFLQNWLVGFINVITGARKIDDLIGIVTAGAWEDEELVQGIMEQLGTAVPYGDLTNIPKSSYNTNYERRTNVRFEEGMEVGILEEARASRANINSAEAKRAAATLALEIQRNNIGFFGYNDGLGRTYGFLNDPNLPSATAFPATGTGSSTLWADKDFLEICADIRLMVVALRTQSQDTIDPETTQMTLALATATVDFLSTTSDFGISVTEWMKEAYPKIRVVSAPQLNDAIMSENAAYLFAEVIDDASSTDDKRTWVQVVPAKFRLNGVEQKAKSYIEDYGNATCGAFLKRPWAVVIRYGN